MMISFCYLFYSAQQPKESTPFELALVLVRFDHAASFIVNANYGVM
jgi:hypothetical protein